MLIGLSACESLPGNCLPPPELSPAGPEGIMLGIVLEEEF